MTKYHDIIVSTKRQTPEKYHVIVAKNFIGHRTSKGADCQCEPEAITPNSLPDFRLYIHNVAKEKK